MTFRDRRPEVRQERDVVPLKGVLLVGLATLLVGVALSLFAIGVATERERTLRPSGEFPEQHLLMPEEVYGVHQGLFGLLPNAELYDRAPRRDLATYGWIDKERRLVRIPIEAAMKLRADGVTP